jgi:hypothetical protein
MEESQITIDEFMVECKIENISNNCYKMIIKQHEKLPLRQKNQHQMVQSLHFGTMAIAYNDTPPCPSQSISVHNSLNWSKKEKLGANSLIP